MTQTPQHRYGHRHEILHNKQGSPFNQDTPLRAEDFLNPRPGDVFYHGDLHDEELARVRRSLRRLFRPKPALSVLSQVKLMLPPPATSHPMPDLIIVENLPAPNRPRTVLDMIGEAVVPTGVIEITSPRLAEYDLSHKRALYAAAGIPEYIVLDTGLRADRTEPAYALLIYRLTRGSYAAVAPEPDGKVTSSALGAQLGLGQGGFQVIDPATGRPIQSEAEDDDSLSAAQAEGRFRAQSIASQLKL